jgi:hypothetical protein
MGPHSCDYLVCDSLVTDTANYHTFDPEPSRTFQNLSFGYTLGFPLAGLGKDV